MKKCKAARGFRCSEVVDMAIATTDHAELGIANTIYNGEVASEAITF